MADKGLPKITSVPPKADEDEDEDEIPMRPKTIKLFTNRPHNLGFDEAEDTQVGGSAARSVPDIEFPVR
jgi:hypothetical protein